MDINAALTAEFHLRPQQVENTVKLIDDGNTIPFIARYRKEMTGSLDDQVLRELHERLLYLRNLDEQREDVYKRQVQMNELDEVTYKGLIVCILGNIHSPRQLSLIYRFAQSLYRCV